MRVKKSLIGSVNIGGLPARLGHTRDFSAVGKFTEANTAETKHADKGAVTPTTPAAIHLASGKLWLFVGLGNL